MTDHRSTHRGLRVSIVAGLVVHAAVLTVGFVALNGEDMWTPLYGYNIPQIPTPSTVEWVAGTEPLPAVVVSGTKCSKEPVAVIGQSSWRSLEPRGSYVSLGEAVGRRVEGCETFRWVNPLPAEVLDLTARLGGSAVWELSGTDTPVRSDGAGAVATWHTEPVTVIVSVPTIETL